MDNVWYSLVYAIWVISILTREHPRIYLCQLIKSRYYAQIIQWTDGPITYSVYFARKSWTKFFVNFSFKFSSKSKQILINYSPCPTYGHYICSFTFSIKNVVVREAIFVISSVVKHVCLFELDIQLCDILLEKLNSASRRNEDIVNAFRRCVTNWIAI
jgi:hypothetical protein